jgi:hypothetical protein
MGWIGVPFGLRLGGLRVLFARHVEVWQVVRVDGLARRSRARGVAPPEPQLADDQRLLDHGLRPLRLDLSDGKGLRDVGL